MKSQLAASLCLILAAIGPSNSQEVEPVMVSKRNSDGAYLGIAAQGILHMSDDGCLVLDGQSLIIWSAGSRAFRTGDGRIGVVDGASGKTVYSGESIGVGGGSGVGPFPIERLAEPIPDACADLPYTLGAYLQTADEIRQQESQAPISSAATASTVAVWTDDTRREVTRLVLGRFGERVFGMTFENEPRPHLVVQLAGDEAVPSGRHQFGAYFVDARFEIGASVREGGLVDGRWENGLLQDKTPQ